MSTLASTNMLVPDGGSSCAVSTRLARSTCWAPVSPAGLGITDVPADLTETGPKASDNDHQAENCDSLHKKLPTARKGPSLKAIDFGPVVYHGSLYPTT